MTEGAASAPWTPAMAATEEVTIPFIKSLKLFFMAKVDYYLQKLRLGYSCFDGVKGFRKFFKPLIELNYPYRIIISTIHPSSTEPRWFPQSCH